MLPGSGTGLSLGFQFKLELRRLLCPCCWWIVMRKDGDTGKGGDYKYRKGKETLVGLYVYLSESG